MSLLVVECGASAVLLPAETSTLILQAELGLKGIGSDTTIDHPLSLNVESLLGEAGAAKGALGISPESLGESGHSRPDL